MKVLVCGASGFIGREICAGLEATGHQVVRGVRQARLSDDLQIDFNTDISSDLWLDRLQDIDAVVNTVGIIVERAGASFANVHQLAPVALFDACVRSRIQRVIQVSALGADKGDTPYFLSKYAADQHLSHLSLEWQILRPSLVYGQEGVSASMFRMLATMPVIAIPSLADAIFQPIHIDDLVQAVLRAIDPQTATRQTLNLVGAIPVSYREMLKRYRQSMKIHQDPVWILIPAPIMSVVATMAGWIPGSTLNPQTWHMLQAGSADNALATAQFLGREPKGINEFIPVSRAELLRFRGRAAWRNPMLKYVLALVWILTALVSAFIYPAAESIKLLARARLSGTMAYVALYGASALDLMLGIATIVRPGRILWVMQGTIILVYSTIIAFALPEYLSHPFGPLIKNLPILAILFTLYAEEDQHGLSNR